MKVIKMPKNMQEKIEERTYEAIDNIADEIGLDNSKYPEVYWIGRNFKFENLGLSEREREDYEFIIKRKQSSSSHRPLIILIGRDNLEHIAEEAGHHLHFVNSKIKFSKRNKKDLIALHTLIEMFGFFFSKLITPKREAIFQEYPDIVSSQQECKNQIEEKNFNFEEFFIYQQGYGLGEHLFNAYISGLVSAKKIYNFSRSSFEGKDEALKSFICLKYKLIDYLNSNY